MLCGCISISMASLIKRSMYSVFAERCFVSCSLMMWSWVKLCSATADLSGWASLMCLSCSLIRTWMDDHSVLCKPCRIRKGCCRFPEFLVLPHPILMASYWLFSWVVRRCFLYCASRKFCWVGLCRGGVWNVSSSREFLGALCSSFSGFIARRMCCWLYPLFLKTVVRKLSSCARESWSQRAFALCMREERTECLLAGWWWEMKLRIYEYKNLLSL